MLFGELLGWWEYLVGDGLSFLQGRASKWFQSARERGSVSANHSPLRRQHKFRTHLQLKRDATRFLAEPSFQIARNLLISIANWRYIP